MDQAAILAEVYRRNALRKQAGLPLLDVREEVNKAIDLARLHEWHEFMASKQADGRSDQERSPSRISC